MISLVVPVRDEPAAWPSNFAAVASRLEIVVVDGSDPPAPEPGFPCRILALPGASRGARLDAGARAASGEVLFFLHADSRPPDDAPERIAEAAARGIPAGCFRLAFRDPTPALRLVAWGANLRARWLRLPFGDQGIFCTRAVYAASGGFRDLPICDDLDFARRLRRLPGFAVLRAECATSPRRYRGRAARQVLGNARVIAGYFAGVAPERLEKWYRG